MSEMWISHFLQGNNHNKKHFKNEPTSKQESCDKEKATEVVITKSKKKQNKTN